MDLSPFIRPRVDLKRIAQVFDEISHAGRVAAIGRLSLADQAALFEAAAGFRAITLDDFVPKSVKIGTPVIHYGVNSLKAFTHFQKRWCRMAPGDELIGYNHQMMQWLTGPGYFTGKQGKPGEVLIDYTITPTEKPESWPKIQANSSGPASVVYGGMIDVMRGISTHVTIGRAQKKGKFVDNWFLLCRES